MTLELSPNRWDISKGDAMLQAIEHARLPLCITDPTLSDNPIVYVNQAFCELTGYTADEVLGRNCRFLQGEETTRASIDLVRSTIDNKAVDTVAIVNYRKDGSKFHNALQIGPILDENGKIAYFFGSQLDISARLAEEEATRELSNAELVHRLRNITNVMSAMIRLTAREATNTLEFGRKLTERLNILGKAHVDTILATPEKQQSLTELARSILEAYAPIGSSQYHLTGPQIHLPSTSISPVALALHELATNAVKHGALGTHDGVVNISWTVEPPSEKGNKRIQLQWREQNGPKVQPPARRNGSQIIERLLTAAGGSIKYDWHPEGLVVTAEFPGSV